MLQKIIDFLGCGAGESPVEEPEAFQLGGRNPGGTAVADQQGVMGEALDVGGLAFPFRRDIDAQAIVAIAVEGINDEIQERQPAGQPAGQPEDQ